MKPTAQSEEMVEVRLRYRPVGDVLTLTVHSEGPPGRRFQTEIDDDTLVEWERMPNGTTQMTAMQLIARGPDSSTEPWSDLAGPLRSAALDLAQPGRHHHDHPSAHRRVPTTGAVESTVAVFPSDLQIGHPTTI